MEEMSFRKVSSWEILIEMRKGIKKLELGKLSAALFTWLCYRMLVQIGRQLEKEIGLSLK